MPSSEHTPDGQQGVEAAILDVVLPRTSACAATARGCLSDAVGDRLSPTALERALLAVSELVSNAWRHGQGTIALKAGYRPGALRVEVIDEGEGARPAIRQGDGSGGWGLRIVDEVSLRWGWFQGTTHVWADLPLS